MRIIKISLAVGLLAVTGWLSYSLLTGISEADIYAYHEADYRTTDRKLQPGSIAAVSETGNISQICSLAYPSTPEDDLETAIYYNQLKEDFPAYVGSIRLLLGAVREEETDDSAQHLVTQNTFVAPDALLSGRSFSGKAREIKDLREATEFAEPDCEARMAWHLSEGYKVCTVRKALNAAVLRNDGSIEVTTVAVAFAEHSNFVGESTFKKAELSYNQAAREANGQPCSGSSLPWQAKMRRTLGVIQRVVTQQAS